MKQKRTMYYELDNADGYAALQAFEDLAKCRMAEFLGPDWKFGWMRDRCKVRTLAVCTHKHGGKIYLKSGWLLFSRDIVVKWKSGKWTPGQLHDIIMHEIAHALTDGRKLKFTWEESNGPKSHTPEWLAKARELGVSEEHLAPYMNKPANHPKTSP